MDIKCLTQSNRSAIICLVALFVFQGGMNAQETVTLSQCYEWTHQNYPMVRQYELIDKTEYYNLTNAAKGWLPQVNINAKATYQSDVTKLPFDSEKISTIIPGFEIPELSKDQYQVSAEISQTIWDGGLIHSNRAMTKAEAAADREQLESDLYALNERVNQLYFGCLLQDELIRQNELLQKELQINIDRIEAMIQNGVANQTDKESLEVELLNACQKAIELKASRTAYITMLGALTGHPMEPVRLEIPVLPITNLTADINRPELRALEARALQIQTQYKLLNAGLMPRIGAFIQGGYGRPGLNMLEDSFDAFYMAGVRLSWDLGSFYTRKNDRRKVEVGLRNVDIQRETFLFNTRLELMQQDTEIRKISDLMRSDEDIIRLRTNIKKAAEVKLENGVISVTDLIREINAEDMAKQNAATHRIQHLMAVYNYLYITN